MPKKLLAVTGSQKTASNCGGLEPFKNEDEFKRSLSKALDDGYGVVLSDDELTIAAGNINRFLECFF